MREIFWKCVKKKNCEYCFGIMFFAGLNLDVMIKKMLNNDINVLEMWWKRESAKSCQSFRIMLFLDSKLEDWVCK